MKYRLIITLMMMALSLCLTSCSTDGPDFTPTPEQPVTPPPSDNPDNGDDNDNPMSNKLRITVGAASFDATLEDNAAATASSRPGTIRTGDLMLYGANCLVIFYKTFSSSYSYTRLGRIGNPSGLEAALGSGSATITFELQ